MKKYFYILVLLMMSVTMFGQNIEREVDDFTGKIKISTSLSTVFSISEAVKMIKTIENNQITYYLSLHTLSPSCVVDGTGLIIKFSDNTTMTWNEAQIDVDVFGSYGFRYSAFITLTESEAKIFSDKEIRKFRLYIFDAELNKTFPRKLKLAVNELLAAK